MGITQRDINHINVVLGGNTADILEQNEKSGTLIWVLSDGHPYRDIIAQCKKRPPHKAQVQLLTP
jgi:hypothetical protein